MDANSAVRKGVFSNTYRIGKKIRRDVNTFIHARKRIVYNTGIYIGGGANASKAMGKGIVSQ